MPVAPALSLAGVTRRFGEGFGEVTALDGVDLQVTAGEVVGLLGHNGAGKTTSVRLFAGLLTADEGEVRVDGLDPAIDGVEVRRRLGVLPARPVVDDRLTARANLRFVADVTGMEVAGLDARIDAALATFELADRADDRVEGYSTGLRQRLALARVLLPRPPILLLDEPTSALDPVAARQVRRTIADLARERGRTVVLCTHDLSEAEALCDRVVVLEQGRVVAAGSPVELAAAHGTGGVLVEVAAHDLVAARRAIEPHTDGVVEVEGGHRLRASTVGRDRIPALVRALVHAGLTVYEVRRSEPTLEEVYLALHGGDRAVTTEDPDRPDGGGR